MPTFLLNASQVPTPITVPTPTLGKPSIPFQTGMTYPPPGTSALFNQVAAALKAVCQNGAGGYGILTGVVLYQAAGLNVGVTAGLLIGDGILELYSGPNPLGGPPFYQVAIPLPYTLQDDATNYVWLTSAGSLIAATTLPFPTQAKWFLGTVTTAGGTITAIDSSGVVSLVNGRFTRQTADIGAPTDAPGFILSTLTATGTYRWNGLSHTFQPLEANIQTLAATLVLGPLSPTVHYLKTNGVNQTVKLPALAQIPPGRGFSIFNYDAANNISIEDSTGVALCTITPGESIAIPSFLDSGGALIWPSGGGAYSPGVPSAGPAGVVTAV